MIIEAVPKIPDEAQNHAGRVWISKDDFIILKIEWGQKHIKNFEKIEALAEKLNSRPRSARYLSTALRKRGPGFPAGIR